MNKQLAWFLGFLASDGSIVRPTYRKKGDEKHIGFTLHYKDRDVLELIKGITSTKARVRNYPKYKSPRCQITIYDRKDLIDKYSKIKSSVPQNIKGYERHYIRGLVDGDGCLNYRHNRKSFRINLINENYDILDKVSEVLSRELSIVKKQPKFKPQDNLYIIEWEGKVANLIAWYLYHGEIQDCVLQRKLDYYHEYVNNKDGLEGFFNSLRIRTNKNHILPVTNYKDSLYWCHIIQKCMISFFGINTTPVPVNKGQKKYYELYVPIANTQDLSIS